MASHTTEQVAEEEQVGHLDGEDGDPAHDFRGGEQLLEDNNAFSEAADADSCSTSSPGPTIRAMLK